MVGHNGFVSMQDIILNHISCVDVSIILHSCVTVGHCIQEQQLSHRATVSVCTDPQYLCDCVAVSQYTEPQ